MSAFSNIASNIFMPIDDAFGIYNREIVHELLVNIQNDFALSLEKSVDMSTLCMIEYRPGDPQCNKIPNGHLIFLSTQGDEWWRWAYQFSHEYCHVNLHQIFLRNFLRILFSTWAHTSSAC